MSSWSFPRIHIELRLGISFRSLPMELQSCFLRVFWTIAVLQVCWYTPMISKDRGCKCSLQCTSLPASTSRQTIWSGLHSLVATSTSKPEALSMVLNVWHSNEVFAILMYMTNESHLWWQCQLCENATTEAIHCSEQNSRLHHSNEKQSICFWEYVQVVVS